MKYGVAGFGLLFVYPIAHELGHLGLVSPNRPLKYPKYLKRVSIENYRHTLQILAKHEKSYLLMVPKVANSTFTLE